MTISYPLSLPASPVPSRVRIDMVDVVGITESTFTLSQEVFRHDGDQWAAQIVLPAQGSAAGFDEWAAFLAALGGRYGTFLLGEFPVRSPRGTWAGTPVVDGAGQSGRTLALRGLSAGATVKKNDRFQLGSAGTSRLYMALTDATADGSGDVTLDIWPRLRESPADGAAVTTSSPKGLFRLADNRRGWDVEPGPFWGISFNAVEAI